MAQKVATAHKMKLQQTLIVLLANSDKWNSDTKYFEIQTSDLMSTPRQGLDSAIHQINHYPVDSVTNQPFQQQGKSIKFHDMNYCLMKRSTMEPLFWG